MWELILSLISNETVVGIVVGALGLYLVPKLTPKNRAWTKLLTTHGEKFFNDVEMNAEELGIKGYEKLARFLSLLSEHLGRQLTPDEESKATEFAAEHAQTLKN